MFKFSFFLFLIFNTGWLEKQNTSQQFQIYETSKFETTYWINTKYISEMTNNLPCLCIDSVNYISSIEINQIDSIEYDVYHTLIPNGKLNFVRQIEPIPFYLIAIENNRYKISIDSKNIIAEIYFNKNTLYFKDSVNIFSFSRVQKNSKMNDINLNFLNMQLNKFGYPSINTLLNEDSLELECNSCLGNINILRSKNHKIIWILELKNKYLYIYKCDEFFRDPLDSLRTKLVMMLNFGNEESKFFGNKDEYQVPLNNFDITGKWYVKEAIYLNTNDTMNISYIKCPYFDFNSNNMFYSENGMNIGSDNIKWSLLDSNIIFINRNLSSIDTSFAKIFEYKNDKMSIVFENIKILLYRNCEEK